MAVEKLKPIDRILETFFSLAAVPVLLGALFKITHTAPFGSPNTWLQVGLYTEALVFLTYGLRYIFAPPKKVDELGVSQDFDIENNGNSFQSNSSHSNENVANITENKSFSSTVPAGINNILSHTNISSESINKLSEGLTSLEASLGKLNSTSNSIVETQEYATKIKEATASLNSLNTFYNKLSETSKAMADSAEDAQKTQKEMALLANNLARLNQIYGSMIIAMQGKQQQ